MSDAGQIGDESPEADAPHPGGPRLLADVGVTHARFALESAPLRLEQSATLNCRDYDSLPAVVTAYLEGIQGERPRHAVIAIANPVQGDEVRMTNRDWRFSIEATRRTLGLDILLVVNDFTAMAMSLPRLGRADRLRIGTGGEPQPGVIGLIGPGSGLGVSGLIPAADHWVTLGSEGGHVSFAPGNPRELDILRHAWTLFGHVSAERLLSGPGLELIWRVLAGRGTLAASAPAAVEIVAQALAEQALAVDVVDTFCGMLGSAAADLALTLGASGGIYIGGGLVPQLGRRLAQSPFRDRFEDKGRFSDYVRRIPTYLVTSQDLSLKGVSAILDQQLRLLRGDTMLLDRVRGALPGMSPAGRKVAQLLLSQPHGFVQDPIATLARNAGVSQPTVIRFCRALGFPGLLDFKRKLASGLSSSIPLQHSQVKAGDRTPDLSAKVLDNTASAILRLRDTIDAQAVGRTIRLLRAAQRIEIFGAGGAGVAGLDGQDAFLHLGIPAAVYPSARLEQAAARSLDAQAVVVAVSETGSQPELLSAVATARGRGVPVVAVTRADSPLAQNADICLAVDSVENDAAQRTMVSRILQLLMLDVMAVGVAMAARRPEPRLGVAGPEHDPHPG
ncbi:glucokinase [Castellaniella caeni]|uniref:glucokinase n=1 Tax=Castellaniella caeni TaxID=266123 RepID=UPI00082EBE4C|nr:glucokinase [Castellaniella caeni]